MIFILPVYPDGESYLKQPFSFFILATELFVLIQTDYMILVVTCVMLRCGRRNKGSYNHNFYGKKPVIYRDFENGPGMISACK